jgi:hypothetical protein
MALRRLLIAPLLQLVETGRLQLHLPAQQIARLRALARAEQITAGEQKNGGAEAAENGIDRHGRFAAVS